MIRRLNRLIVITGTRGTGKTTYLINLLRSLSRRRGTLIINPSQETKFLAAGIPEIKKPASLVVPAGRVRQYIPKVSYAGRIRGDRRKRMQSVIEYFLTRKRTGALVIDDARELFKGQEFTDVFETYLLAGRQNDIDIILILHSLGQIPAPIVPYVTDVIIFPSHEASERFFYKLPKSDELFAAQNRVNERSKKSFHVSEWVRLM